MVHTPVSSEELRAPRACLWVRPGLVLAKTTFMRNQVHVVWLDDERGTGKKDSLRKRRFQNSDTRHEHVWERAAPLSLGKLLGPAGSMSRARRLNLCLTW